MPYFIDLGAGPAEEDCAQLGQSPNFDSLNRLEIAVYKSALIARYGPPPPDAASPACPTRHDFGRYVELVLHIENELDEAVADYATRVEEDSPPGARRASPRRSSITARRPPSSMPIRPMPSSARC
jgi:hypothetical protein